VVGFGEGWWVGAAGPGAAAVAFGEGEFLSAGEQSGAGAEVEDLGWSAEHRGDEVGVGGEAAEGAGADGFVDAVDGGGAEAGFEGVVVGADDDGDGGEFGGGATAAGQVSEGFGEGDGASPVDGDERGSVGHGLT